MFASGSTAFLCHWRWTFLLSCLAGIVPVTTAKCAAPPLDDFATDLKTRSFDWSPHVAIAWANTGGVPLEKKFLSPDKTTSIRLVQGDREYVFVIEDERSKVETRLVASYTPIFSITWSPDSRQIAGSAHAAHSSFLFLLQRDGGRWTMHEVDFPRADPPPVDDFGSAHILGYQFLPGFLRVTYLSSVINQRHDYKLYRGSFRVDLATGKTRGGHLERISDKEYRALRTANN